MSFKARDFAVGPNDSLWGDDSPLPGTDMQLLAGSQHTDGHFSLVRYTITTEIYPHVHHNEDESIYLVDGAISVTIGEKQYELTPGSFIFMPRGVPHAIQAHTPSWKGLSISAPAAHFQACMEELLAFTKAGNELTMEALLDIQQRHGVENVSDMKQWYDMEGARK